MSNLGLGTAEPTWGLMLSGSAPSYAEKAPSMAVIPGLAISLAMTLNDRTRPIIGGVRCRYRRPVGPYTGVWHSEGVARRDLCFALRRMSD